MKYELATWSALGQRAVLQVSNAKIRENTHGHFVGESSPRIRLGLAGAAVHEGTVWPLVRERGVNVVREHLHQSSCNRGSFAGAKGARGRPNDRRRPRLSRRRRRRNDARARVEHLPDEVEGLLG